MVIYIFLKINMVNFPTLDVKINIPHLNNSGTFRLVRGDQVTSW